MLHITPPQRDGMRNNIRSLPSIYSHHKLEPLLCCNNHLRWMSPLLYIFQSGMLTHYPHRQNAVWFMAMTEAFDCLCVCGAAIRKWSLQQKSNKEHTVHWSSHHNCGYLQIDIAVPSPDIFSVPVSQMNQRLHPPPPQAYLTHLQRVILCVILTSQSHLSFCLPPPGIGTMSQSQAF